MHTNSMNFKICSSASVDNTSQSHSLLDWDTQANHAHEQGVDGRDRGTVCKTCVRLFDKKEHVPCVALLPEANLLAHRIWMRLGSIT